ADRRRSPLAMTITVSGMQTFSHPSGLAVQLGFLAVITGKRRRYHDTGEALLDRGRNELSGHFEKRVLGHDAWPADVTLAADFEWDVEKQRLHLTAIRLADADIGRALLRREVGSVDVGNRPGERETLPKKIT